MARYFGRCADIPPLSAVLGHLACRERFAVSVRPWSRTTVTRPRTVPVAHWFMGAGPPAPAGRGGDGSEVLGVRADHKVVTAECALDDGTSTTSSAAERAARRRQRGLVDVECFDVAAHEQGAVAGPHAALAAVGRDEHARVVGDAHYALRRRREPDRPARFNASAVQRSASAISSAVNAPWSRSNCATACRPVWMMNSLRAVAASRAGYRSYLPAHGGLDLVVQVGGIEIDRFFRTAMP